MRHQQSKDPCLESNLFQISLWDSIRTKKQRRTPLVSQTATWFHNSDWREIRYVPALELFTVDVGNRHLFMAVVRVRPSSPPMSPLLVAPTPAYGDWNVMSIYFLRWSYETKVSIRKKICHCNGKIKFLFDGLKQHWFSSFYRKVWI